MFRIYTTVFVMILYLFASSFLCSCKIYLLTYQKTANNLCGMTQA